MVKRSISLTLVFIFIFSCFSIFVTSASGANVCTQISGSAKEKYTFTVETGSRWLFSEKITLKQSKGVLEYKNLWYKTKTMKAYATYKITVHDANGKLVQEKIWDDASITIKLKANSSYKITVSPANKNDMQLGFLKSLKARAINKWTEYPTWYIAKTKGIYLCH